MRFGGWIIAAFLTTAVVGAHAFQLAAAPPGAAPAAPAIAQVERVEAHFALGAPRDFRAIAERPLFSESRRPPARRPETAAPRPPPPALTLAGVLATETGKVALLSDASGAMLRLRLEQEFEGWRVLELSNRRIVLAQGDRRARAGLMETIAEAGPPRNGGAADGAPPPRSPRPAEAFSESGADFLDEFDDDD